MTVISFGPFTLDRDNGTLSRGGKGVALGQHGVALLGALLDAHGLVVEKSSLMAAGWPGKFVEEGNLTVQVASLRRALGERIDGQEWIVTVPRVGYRLIQAGAGSGDPELESASRLPALVVLPFNNLGGVPEQEYFADGMVEDLITALSRFRNFVVMSRNSAFVYRGRAVDVRQVARELGATYVLEGGVQRAGKMLRITAQLVDGETGGALWAERFDGAIDDVFDMQDRVCARVAATIEPTVTLAEIARSRRVRPDSLEAYDLYLQALPHMHVELPEANAAGYRLANQAIDLAPNYAPALSLASWFLEHRVHMGWPLLHVDDVARFAELTERAVANTGDDARLLAASGYILMVAKQFDRGYALTRRALELNPNNFMVLSGAGVVDLHIGSVDDALKYFMRAIELSTREVRAYVTLSGIAHMKMYQGDYQEALHWAERSMAVNARFPPTHWMSIAANAHLGHMDEARRLLAAFLALEPKVTLRSIHDGQPNKYPDRTAATEAGLRLAGLPES